MGLMLCTEASFVLGRLLRFGNGAPRSEHRKIETSALSAADFQFQQLLHLETDENALRLSRSQLKINRGRGLVSEPSDAHRT